MNICTECHGNLFKGTEASSSPVGSKGQRVFMSGRALKKKAFNIF